MKKRRAFTLVEILTAVAIIAIMIGMAVMSYRYVSRNSRADQTRVAMEAAKMVLTEFESAGGSMRYFTSPTQGMYYVAGNKPPCYIALPAKTPATDMSPDGANRHGPEALRNARAMRLLAMTGGMQRRLYELPSELRAYLEFHQGLTYRNGDELKVGDRFYRFSDPTPTQTLTTTTAPPSANWVETPIDKITPMLVDGERNLLLFVTGDGLMVTQGGVSNVRVTSIRPVRPSEPDYETLGGKPYFVAPGPDADYTTGEDNDYSMSR